MRHRSRLLLLSGMLVAALAGSAIPAHAATVTLSQGHVDVVDLDYAASALTADVRDSTVSPAVDRAPADVLFQVTTQARTTVPTNTKYAFLGTPGAPVWILPQTQKASVLWPGWSTEGVSAGVLTGDAVTLKLVGVTGPAHFSVYSTDAFGSPTVLFDSGNGLPDSLSVPVNTHRHANWAFEAAGSYTITFEATGTRTAGGQVSSGQVAYRFDVAA